MGDCAYPGCSGDDSMKNSCSYCGDGYCSEHRLPENHDCPAVSAANTLGPDFRASGEQAKIGSDSGGGLLSRLKSLLSR
ncbi:AN1-type zinc finger domain-containing protein [Halopiger thermotolerans]